MASGGLTVIPSAPFVRRIAINSPPKGADVGRIYVCLKSKWSKIESSILTVVQAVYLVPFSFFFLTSLLLSSSTRWRFYPQRSSGQAVVAGVVPSPPRYVPSIYVAYRVQHSHCSSIFIEGCELTLSRFPLINFFMQEKVPTSMCTRWELNSRNWF